MKIQELTTLLEEWAPLSLQEEYDNAGLLVGDYNTEVHAALLCLDITEEVLEEAETLGCNLIIAHHPVIFKGLKKLNGKTHVERVVIKAIQKNIALYAIHTNLDNVHTGVNAELARRLGLRNVQILSPKNTTLGKLSVFVPKMHTEKLLSHLHEAGAGNIGNYSECSFRVAGTGTFLPNKFANPQIGEVGKKENVEEERIEVIFPKHLEKKILQAMRNGHVYEEVSYFLEDLQNNHQEIGSGMIGYLEKPLEVKEFLTLVKNNLQGEVIKYTPTRKKFIEKVAVCGGSGSFLLHTATYSGADAFVTSDFKYHEYFNAEGRILITDVGHYETEHFTKDLLKDFFSKKIPNFATYLSKVNTNPVQYFY